MADIRGVIPILKTPFDLEDRVDEESLRREVDYCIDAGAHGLGIAFGSEMPKLSEAERTLVARITIDQARGRVPVVMSTGCPATVLALRASREAEALGASAVMLIPPANGLSAAELHGYFRAVAACHSHTHRLASDDRCAPLRRRAGGAGPSGAARCDTPRSRAPRRRSPSPKPLTRPATRVTIIGGASGGALIQELAVRIAGHHAARHPGRIVRAHLGPLARRRRREAARETWQTRDRAPQRHRRGGVQGDAASRGRDRAQSLPRASREPLGRRGAASNSISSVRRLASANPPHPA